MCVLRMLLLAAFTVGMATLIFALMVLAWLPTVLRSSKPHKSYVLHHRLPFVCGSAPRFIPDPHRYASSNARRAALMALLSVFFFPSVGVGDLGQGRVPHAEKWERANGGTRGFLREAEGSGEPTMAGAA
jgi:hypothetical protein